MVPGDSRPSNRSSPSLTSEPEPTVAEPTFEPERSIEPASGTRRPSGPSSRSVVDAAPEERRPDHRTRRTRDSRRPVGRSAERRVRSPPAPPSFGSSPRLAHSPIRRRGRSPPGAPESEHTSPPATCHRSCRPYPGYRSDGPTASPPQLNGPTGPPAASSPHRRDPSPLKAALSVSTRSLRRPTGRRTGTRCSRRVIRAARSITTRSRRAHHSHVSTRKRFASACARSAKSSNSAATAKVPPATTEIRPISEVIVDGCCREPELARRPIRRAGRGRAQAVVVSSDGLPLAVSANVERETTERLAAVASG